MGFNNSNYGQNGFGSNNGGGAMSNGEKKSYNVGRLYASDGKLAVGVYKSEKGGLYTTLSITGAIGKDPSNGTTVYQQKPPQELPSVLMTQEALRAVLEYFKIKRPEELNVDIDLSRGNRLTVQGNSNGVKIGVINPKNGNGTVTLEATNVGDKSIHAGFLTLVDYLEICSLYMKMSRLDENEFSKVISNNGGNVVGGELPTGNGGEDVIPF